MQIASILLGNLVFWISIALIVGLIFPKTFNWIFKGKANRKKISLVCCIPLIIAIVLTIVFSMGTPTIAKIKTPTNQKKIAIDGTSAYDNSKVRIFRNNDSLNEVVADKDGKFSAEIELTEGSNKIKATSTNDKGRTQTSSEVEVVLDLIAPKLDLDQPKSPTDSDKFTLTGKSEKNAKVVVYLGDKELKQAQVKKESFEIKDLPLNEGENKFTVKAIDEVDNYSEAKEIAVVYNKPEAKEEVKPSETPINNLTYNEVTSYEIGDATWKIIVFSRKPDQNELIKSSQELHKKDNKAYYHLFDSDEKVEQFKNWDLNYGKVRDKDGVVKKPTDCINIDYCMNLVKNQNIPFPAPAQSWLDQHELGIINQMMTDNGLKWQLSKPLGEKISEL